MARLNRPHDCKCAYTLNYPLIGNACTACHRTIKITSTTSESATNTKSPVPTSTFRTPRTDNSATLQAKHLVPLPFEYSTTKRPRLNLDAACAQGRELDLKTEKARLEKQAAHLRRPLPLESNTDEDVKIIS